MSNEDTEEISFVIRNGPKSTIREFVKNSEVKTKLGSL